MKVRTFDPFYKQVTFIQEGVYYVGGTSIRVAGRIVAKLGEA